MPRTTSDVLDHRAEADRGVGEWLAAAREKAGLTQLAAARAVGLRQSAIAKMERGKRRLHFLEGLRLLAIYDVDIRELDRFRSGPGTTERPEPGMR
jgi:transcriptional regulator with XRE-family HTH domain